VTSQILQYDDTVCRLHTDTSHNQYGFTRIIETAISLQTSTHVCCQATACHVISLAFQPISVICRLFWRFLNNTHTVGLLWLSDQPVPKAPTCSTCNKHKRWTSMPSAGFEPAIAAIKGTAGICLRPHSSRNRRCHIPKQLHSLLKATDIIIVIIQWRFYHWDAHINGTHVRNFFRNHKLKK